MKILTINKKANFDYEILEKYEAGLVLFGHEVKSVKLGQANLKASYISFKLNSKGKNEAYLINCYIPLYKPAGIKDDYHPERPRKVLLKSKEIDNLTIKKQEKGLTVIPIKLYTKGSFIKLELAVVRGKKKYDKRDDLKRKDVDRQLRTLTKQRIRS